ncbi:hypothetical protein Barb4_03290 [Bacteroidales bacterium Barb4]|nr:hypothetical protein Barb4_03290 [Bacteroidales bacterium Barb4]
MQKQIGFQRVHPDFQSVYPALQFANVRVVYAYPRSKRNTNNEQFYFFCISFEHNLIRRLIKDVINCCIKKPSIHV